MRKKQRDIELNNEIVRLISTISYERQKAFIFFLHHSGDLKGEELFLYLSDLFSSVDQ